MKSLCVITARGGSKRIPRKNIKDFLGKPIIAYSILSALDSGLFDEVMVSTDDKEIAEIVLEYGAKVPFMRSEKNSDDHATTYDVIKEVINKYKDQKRNFDYLCCFYPTSPLIDSKTLKDGFNLLIEGEYKTAFSVGEYSSPIQRALRSSNGRLEMFHPEFQNSRSQDLEPAYFDAGQFYWFDLAKIKNEQHVYTDNSGLLVLDNDKVQDIDSISDWKLAELKYQMLQDEER